MRLVAVEVEDFGVFSGTHRLRLVDHEVRSGRPPRVLIIGHNGSGKSTLFHAISLAMYGPATFDGRLSRRAYEQHLRGMVHHGRVVAHDGNVATASRVAVDLEFVRRGVSETVRFERSWRCTHSAVKETVSAFLLQDDGTIGQAVNEQVLVELLPPDLRKMMLVDVALIAELTQALQSPRALERMLRELSALGWCSG